MGAISHGKQGCGYVCMMCMRISPWARGHRTLKGASATRTHSAAVSVLVREHVALSLPARLFFVSYPHRLPHVPGWCIRVGIHGYGLCRHNACPVVCAPADPCCPPFSQLDSPLLCHAVTSGAVCPRETCGQRGRQSSLLSSFAAKPVLRVGVVLVVMMMV